MTLFGLSIDDDDKGLSDDDDLTLKEVADEGVKMEEVDCRLHAEFNEFEVFLLHCTSFTRCSAEGRRKAAGVATIF